MAKVIRYTQETQDQFDQRTRVVLDALQQRFSAVELQPPEGGQQEWFVGVWQDDDADLPTGFFDRDPYSAALRLARAFGIKVELNDTDPM